MDLFENTEPAPEPPGAARRAAAVRRMRAAQQTEMAEDPADKARYPPFDPIRRAALRDFTTDRTDATESPFEHVPIRNRAAWTSAQGVGDDNEVRLKVNQWSDGGDRTVFAVMPLVRVPIGAAEVGPGPEEGDVEGGLILPLAVELPAGFGLGTMAEFDLTYDEGRRDHAVDFVYSATLGHKLAEPRRLCRICRRGPARRRRELPRDRPHGLADGMTAAWNIGGGATFGLSGDTDDLTLFVGTSVRF